MTVFPTKESEVVAAEYWQDQTVRCGNLAVKSELLLFEHLCPYLQGDRKIIENSKTPKPNIYAK